MKELNEYIQNLIDKFLSIEEQEKYQDDPSYMQYLAEERAYELYEELTDLP